jgi:hypothetical protein
MPWATVLFKGTIGLETEILAELWALPRNAGARTTPLASVKHTARKHHWVNKAINTVACAFILPNIDV